MTDLETSGLTEPSIRFFEKTVWSAKDMRGKIDMVLGLTATVDKHNQPVPKSRDEIREALSSAGVVFVEKGIEVIEEPQGDSGTKTKLVLLEDPNRLTGQIDEISVYPDDPSSVRDLRNRRNIVSASLDRLVAAEGNELERSKAIVEVRRAYDQLFKPKPRILRKGR